MSYVRTSGRRNNHIFVPFNAKIGDITHADLNKHTLTLANPAGTGALTGESRKVIAVFLNVDRMAGAGSFRTYPNEGATADLLAWSGPTSSTVIANGTQRLQYALTVAGDDFDLYCFGYVVES